MRRTLLAFAAALLCGGAAAQTTVWSRAEYGVATASNDGGGGHAQSKHVAFGPDGSIFAASTFFNGKDDDAVLMRVSPGGTRQWVRFFNSRVEDDDELQSLSVDAAANASLTSIHFDGSTWKAVTAQFAPDGTPRWTHVHQHATYASRTSQAVDAAGNIAVAVSGGGELSLSLLSPGGVVQWRWTALEASSPYAVQVAFDAAGNVYIVYVGAPIYAPLYVQKLSAGGAPLWSDEISAPNVYLRAAAVVVDASGNLLIAGVRDADALLIKFASGGGLQWQRTYNGAANDYDQATGVGVDAAGNVVIAGSTDGATAFVQRYAPDGTPQWTRTLAGTRSWTGVRVDASGDAVVVGSVAQNGTSHTIVRRYDAAGGTAWTQTYQPGSLDFNFAGALAWEPGGAVAIVGFRQDTPSTSLFLWSLAGATGVTAWSDDNPLLGADLASTFSDLSPSRSLIAADLDGNVVIAANGFSGRRSFEAIAAKYAPDGVRQWRVSHGSATEAVFANAVATNALGGVVMTGSQQPLAGGMSDLFVNLYDASGVLRWSRTFAGAGGRFAAVDAGGNVYVAGNVSTDSTLNMLLLKYSPAGTLLWSRTYRDPAEYSTIDGFALDPSGQPMLADAEPSRVRVVKYSSAGAIVWEYERAPQSGFAGFDFLLDTPGNAYYAYGGELVKVATTGLFAWTSPTLHDAQLAVSAANDVFVFGRYTGIGVDKFAPDGTRAWAAGLGTDVRDASAIAVDPLGHVIAVNAFDPLPDGDIATSKLAATNGTPLWRHEYAGAELARDQGYAVLALGDAVYVAATTRERGVPESVRLIKIANPPDTTPPETTITLAPADPSPTNEVVFTFESNEPVAQFECSMDGATFWYCTSPARYILALGSHTFQVRAQDRGGNLDPTPASHAFTVTKLLPNVWISPYLNTVIVGTTAQFEAGIYGFVPATGTFEFRFGGQPLPGCSAVPLVPTYYGYGATCGYAGFAAGRHLVQARYSGDSTYIAATAETIIDVNVNPPPPCGGFADVPDSSPFCGNVGWMASRNVTLGCAPGIYCSDAPVLRLSMAAFMNRLGHALSPQMLSREQALASVVPDGGPLLCQTSDFAIEDAPRSIVVDAVIAANSGQTVIADAEVVFSYDAGVSWVNAFPAGRLSATANRWSNVRVTSVADVGAGEPIRAALRLKRNLSDVGTDGFDAVTCHLRARVNNADSPFPPF